MFALALRVRPWLAGRNEGCRATEMAVVEDDEPESQRPLYEVITGEDVSVEFRRRQRVQVELAGEVAGEDWRPDEVVVEVADRGA